MIESYVCVDLETTGLDPKRDKILEIGAVKVVNNEIAAEWGTFVNPGRKLEERIVQLTGICDEQLEDAPGIEEAFPQLLGVIGEEVLLGHRVLFDYSFLKKAAVDQKLPFERSGIDTLGIARKYLKDLESRGLVHLCQHYGISHNAHRALGDAKATVQLYQKLAEQFSSMEAAEEEKNLFNPRPLHFHVKRDTPITTAQKEQLYKLLDKHKLIVEYDVAKLTRSEASRRIDQLLAKYGR